MAKKQIIDATTEGQTVGRGGRNKYNVSPVEFITAWQTSHSVQEVSDKLDTPKPIVLARASAYRKNNIKLKHMPRSDKRSLNVDELNRLIEGLNAGRTPEDVAADPRDEHVMTLEEVKALIDEKFQTIVDMLKAKK